MKRAYKSRWKVFVSLPFWENVQILNENMFLGFVYSYLAENRSLILSRGFDFVGNVMLNFFKDSGDKEQSFCFMRNYGLIHVSLKNMFNFCAK